MVRSQQPDVCNARAAKRQSVRRLCRSASKHAASAKDKMHALCKFQHCTGAVPTPSNARAGTATQRPDALMAWERGRAVSSTNKNGEDINDTAIASAGLDPFREYWNPLTAHAHGTGFC